MATVSMTALPAAAQDRLFAILPQSFVNNAQSRSVLIEVDTRPGSIGQIRRQVSLPDQDKPSGVVVVDHGRYLVWAEGAATRVNFYDAVANRSGGVYPQVGLDARILAGDPRRPRVFMASEAGITIVDGASGEVRAVTPWAPATVSVGAFSSALNRLFVANRGAGPPRVDVIDVEQGVVERSMVLGTQFIADIAVDRSGTRLFVASDVTTPGSRLGLDVYAVDTGALLGHADVPGRQQFTREGILQLDESRGRVLIKSVANEIGQLQVTAYDLQTVAPLGTVAGAWLDALAGAFPMQWLQGPRSLAYVLTGVYSPFTGCGARFEARNPDTGAAVQALDVSRLWSGSPSGSVCAAQLALMSPPLAPTLTTSVHGSRVTLSWSGIDDATHYDLEAGSAPGLANLLTSAGHAGTSLNVDGVPPGTYYVRVRAINWVGRSLPSQEVQVVVP